jgi:hypothetical protein
MAVSGVARWKKLWDLGQACFVMAYATVSVEE